MAIISFGTTSDAVWGGAGWAFRQILRDLSAVTDTDSEVVATLREAEPLGSLVVDLLDQDLQHELRTLLWQCVTRYSTARDRAQFPSFMAIRKRKISIAGS
jgi:hypothetical protein